MSTIFKLSCVAAACLAFNAAGVFAQADTAADAAPVPAVDATTAPAATDATPLPPVSAESKPWMFNRETRYSHLLPEVDGTHVTVTKKNSVENLDQQPTIIDNNQREMFARLPGVVVAEQQTPGQLNINYRGIGGAGPLGTQESELVLAMQDGIPTASDWIGFPTQYYLPWPQSIQSVQLIRGGSALMYGPGAGVALNYVSRQPDPDHELSGYSEQVFGSNALYSTFNTVSGTKGDWNYLVNANYRKSDGERANGDYEGKGGDVHLGYNLGGGQRLALDVHTYSTDNGEAGRMPYTTFLTNDHATTTPNDHDWVERYTGVLSYQGNFGDNLLVESKFWGGYHDQAERNFAAGNAAPTCPTAGTCYNITDQVFHYLGLDTRARLRWGHGNALTTGFVLYDSHAPSTKYSTSNAAAQGDDETGFPILKQRREEKYMAAFAENVFRFGRFHILPSVRLEREIIDINEDAAPAFTSGASAGTRRAAINHVFTNNTPLFGLGFGNDFGKGNETYFNISQGYRPVRYLDVAPTSTTPISVNNNPETSKSLTYEAGVHGWPVVGLYYDVSVFQTNYRNRIESVSTGVGSEVINVNSGDTRHRGIELETEYDFLGWIKPDKAADDHLSIFLNADYLDAEFTATRNATIAVGNTPGYAPHYVVREGLLWRKDKAYKFSLTAVSTASQYVQDSDQPLAPLPAPAKIPAYTVVDFGADYTVMPHLRLLGGVTNLADRKYYSRVLFGGVEPANGRNFYLGFSAEL